MIIEKFVFDAQAKTLTVKIVAESAEEEVNIRAWICNQDDFSCVNDVPDIPLVDSEGSADITSNVEKIFDLEYSLVAAQTEGKVYNLDTDLFFVYITYGSTSPETSTIAGVKPMYDSTTIYNSLLDQILSSVDTCNCCETVDNLPITPLILFDGAIIALNIAEYQNAILLWKRMQRLVFSTDSSSSGCSCNS